jgi:NADH-quinone oxidoreductase subunit F
MCKRSALAILCCRSSKVKNAFMNIGQVRAAAETQLSYLFDPSCIRIHVGALSSNPNAIGVFRQFQRVVAQGGFQARIVRTGSFGYYGLEPIVTIIKPGLEPIFYTNVTLERVAGLVNDLEIPYVSELPSFSRQSRVALRNCGWIDPEDINFSIVNGQSYVGLAKALNLDAPWTEACDKLLLCNAVDPDLKSLTSQLLLESDPHSVLEGMAIKAFNLGASHGYVLVEEKTEAANRLRKALDQMRAYTLLGRDILDSQFCLEIEIIETPVQWTSGSRIELFRCIEECQSLPHMLPTLPNVSEIYEKPIIIVDPEMMAKASAMKDIDETKVVTLNGSLRRQYTVELAAGTTIRSIIENYGGFVSNGKDIKAVQLGGSTGSFVSPDDLDAAIDWRSIEVFEIDSNIVDVTKRIMTFIQSQSCGKCVFCREGCLQMMTILEDISENKGKPQDLDLLQELGEEMRTGCLCAFGRSAPDPVLSSIQLFRSEYEKRL